MLEEIVEEFEDEEDMWNKMKIGIDSCMVDKDSEE